MDNISVILLAGGSGQRFDSTLPKQFHFLNSKRIALYSFDCFTSMEEVTEIIIVTKNEYKKYFSLEIPCHAQIRFAEPGERRQDSVYNGLLQIQETTNLVCIHDSARPLINSPLVRKIAANVSKSQGAAAGVPLKFTIKNVDENGFVTQTLDRSKIWEVQTPQIVPYHLLNKGFEKTIQENISVTDDLSLLEIIGEKVKLLEASYGNIKITTKEDLIIAENLLKGVYNG